LQSSPLSSDANLKKVLRNAAGRAFYLWLYPNFMIMPTKRNGHKSCFALAVDKCAVVFDYYFPIQPQQRRSQ